MIFGIFLRRFIGIIAVAFGCCSLVRFSCASGPAKFVSGETKCLSVADDRCCTVKKAKCRTKNAKFSKMLIKKLKSTKANAGSSNITKRDMHEISKIAKSLFLRYNEIYNTSMLQERLNMIRGCSFRTCECSLNVKASCDGDIDDDDKSADEDDGEGDDDEEEEKDDADDSGDEDDSDSEDE